MEDDIKGFTQELRPSSSERITPPPRDESTSPSETPRAPPRSDNGDESADLSSAAKGGAKFNESEDTEIEQAELSPFDWTNLEQRFIRDMNKQTDEERQIQDDFDRLVNVRDDGFRLSRHVSHPVLVLSYLAADASGSRGRSCYKKVRLSNARSLELLI